MLNSIDIIGKILTDLELKKTSSESNTVTFRIACPRDHVKPGEERITDIFTATAFGSNATYIVNNFVKGAWIGITGRLESYTPKNSTREHSAVKIRVLSASLTGEFRDADPNLFDNNNP